MAFRPLRLSTNVTDFPSNTEYGDSEFAQVGGLQLFNSLTPPAYQEGQLFYNQTDHALTITSDESSVSQSLGRQTLVRVYNNSGATITKGQVCYITGNEVVEGRPTIGLAQANLMTTSKLLGISAQAIGNNSFGYLTSLGVLSDMDTSSFVVGDVLYLSSTTPGGFTTTAPGGLNSNIQIGFVIVSNAVTGKIFINIEGSADSRSSRPTIVLSFQSAANPHINVNSASYSTVSSFIYAGTDNIFSPTDIRALVAGNNNTGSFRVFDITNLQVIAEVTGQATIADQAIYSLGTVANLPASEAVFSFQVLKSGGGGSLRVAGLSLS